MWITTNCGKFLKTWEYQTTLPVSWEICMQVKKQQLELDMEQWLVPNWERSMLRLYIVTGLFNLYAEYIMWDAGLDEAQAGIKTARRNINNLRYADDTTLMAESEEELKSLLRKVKEGSEKVGLKLNIQNHRIQSHQFSRSVISDSLWSHEPQHARPPCPSSTPGVYPNSRPLSRWCHPTIWSSVVPFSSCPQSFPASGSFQMSQLSTSGGQSIGVSASTSVLPMNTQDWSSLGWTGWISWQSKGLSSLLQHHSSKASILRCSAFFTVQLSHPYMTTGKTIALTRRTFVGKVMLLLFNMLPLLAIVFFQGASIFEFHGYSHHLQ